MLQDFVAPRKTMIRNHTRTTKDIDFNEVLRGYTGHTLSCYIHFNYVLHGGEAWWPST